jgi:Ca2+-binding RTX toxin-like protein
MLTLNARTNLFRIFELDYGAPPLSSIGWVPIETVSLEPAPVETFSIDAVLPALPFVFATDVFPISTLGRNYIFSGLEPLDPISTAGPIVDDGEGNGEWSGLLDWPLIGIHAMALPNGMVLSFGTDARGMQSGEFIYDVWDPLTGEHFTLANTTGTDIFCSNMALVAATGEILISGGDNRPDGGINLGVDDVNVFDFRDNSLEASAFGDMAFERWYNAVITLGDGAILTIGGRDGAGRGVGTPEYFVAGEGWTTLTGAVNLTISSDWWYPRSWLKSDGTVIVIESSGAANRTKVFSLDTAGTGSMIEIGNLPFRTTNDTPSIMIDTDLALIMDDQGNLWTMDFSGGSPVFENVGSVGQARREANMSVLPDGTIAITGGSVGDNTLVGVAREVALFNPDDNSIIIQDDEALARLYHSTGLLLVDGTVLSLGGGAPGPLTNLNAEVFNPAYLYGDDGKLAERPEIIDGPDRVRTTDDIIITVDDAFSIAQMTFLKPGAVTHSRNSDARFLDLTFEIIDANTIRIELPDNSNVTIPGYWMLFAIDDAGVPSIARMIGVNVTDNVVVGSSQSDTLIGTDLDDLMRGKGGGDFFEESLGNDVLMGDETAYDQVNYFGDIDDYTFTRNSDDSIKVENAVTGTDTLIGIDGVWFGGDNQWFSMDELLIPLGSTIEGTSGSDELFGSRGDDTIIGNGGEDYFFESLGDDLLIGDAGIYDQINLSGQLTDYTLTRNDDGSVTVTGEAIGTDTLIEIDGVWFDGDQSWYDMAELLAPPNGDIVGTRGEDIIYGTDGDDIIRGNGGGDYFIGGAGSDTFYGDAELYDQANYDGTLNDYVFRQSADGTVSVVASNGDTDTLIDIDGFYFLGSEQWYSIEDALGQEGATIIGTSEGEELFGTSGSDIMIGNGGGDNFHGSLGNDEIFGDADSYDQMIYEGSAGDYEFVLESDGTITVMGALTGMDVLTNVEGVWFLGSETWYNLVDLT